MTFNYAQPFILAGAFIVKNGKLLLIQENHDPDKGKWNIPIGKLDFGENPIKAASREAFEEAGLTFVPTALLSIHSVHRKDFLEARETHTLRIIFIGNTDGEVSLEHGQPVDGIPEISNYKWLSFDEVLNLDDKELRYRDIKNLVKKYQKQISYPLELIEHFIQI